MDGYKIVAKSSFSCGKCEKKYEKEEPCFSFLQEKIEENVLVKESCCVECWKIFENPKSLLCFWKSLGKKKDPQKNEFDREFAINLFLSLMNSRDEKQKKIQYLLALILSRKKILKWDRLSFQNGQEILHLRFVGKKNSFFNKSPISITIPPFEEKELNLLKEELIQNLTKHE